MTIGFDKNPLSFSFTRKIKHLISPGIHEVQRNQTLIEAITDERPAMPRVSHASAEDLSHRHTDRMSNDRVKTTRAASRRGDGQIAR